MTQLTETQVNDLKLLANNHAFQLYLDLLQERFDYEYKKLRNSKKSDQSFARVCGKLDGLESAIKLVEIQVNE